MKIHICSWVASVGDWVLHLKVVVRITSPMCWWAIDYFQFGNLLKLRSFVCSLLTFCLLLCRNLSGDVTCAFGQKSSAWCAIKLLGEKNWSHQIHSAMSTLSFGISRSISHSIAIFGFNLRLNHRVFTCLRAYGVLFGLYIGQLLVWTLDKPPTASAHLLVLILDAE